eukprot:1087341-Alexandrium_andersonii.AAC.1
MSASLVGSEMCIRDSPYIQWLLSRPPQGPSPLRGPLDSRKPAAIRSGRVPAALSLARFAPRVLAPPDTLDTLRTLVPSWSSRSGSPSYFAYFRAPLVLLLGKLHLFSYFNTGLLHVAGSNFSILIYGALPSLRASFRSRPPFASLPSCVLACVQHNRRGPYVGGGLGGIH